MNKNGLLIMGKCMAGLLICCVFTGGTQALLAGKTNTVTNEFTPGYVNIGIVEGSADSGKIFEDRDNVLEYPTVTPGNIVCKNVWIKNIDLNDFPTTEAYVRVSLVPVLKDGNGHVIGKEINIEWELADSLNWVKSGDYYYYKKPLNPNELSEQLLEGVKLNDEAIQENYHLEVQVLADAVMAEPDNGNTSTTPVVKAWGVYPPALLK